MTTPGGSFKMFKVFVNDGSEKLPTDDIMYIVAKDGIFLKKKLGVMESIAPVKNISILKEIETMARMHITKIPTPMIAKTLEFFRTVNTDIKGSEAIVLNYYNEENGKHKIEAPFQKVSGAALDYTKPASPEGWTMIGTIHSHNTMSAWHSSIDDADEKHFDGLHITIGNVDEEYASISASIVSNGTRFMVDPRDYIDGIRLVVDIDEIEKRPYGNTWKWDSKLKKSIKVESTYTYSVRKYDKRYAVDATDKQKTFNKKWMKKVEYSTPTYKYGYGYWGGYGGGYGRTSGAYTRSGTQPSGWNGSFDPGVWAQWKKDQEKKTEEKKSKEVVNTFTGTVEVIEEPDVNPCEECAFRDAKLEWMFDQMLEEEYDGKEYWECVGCQLTFCIDESGEGEAICPECHSDDYVVESCKQDFEKESETYKCSACGSETKTEHFNEGLCPFCGSSIDGDETEETRKLTEDEQHFLEVANEEVERIPIPGTNAIPLPKPKKPKGLFQRLLNRGQ